MRVEGIFLNLKTKTSNNPYLIFNSVHLCSSFIHFKKYEWCQRSWITGSEKRGTTLVQGLSVCLVSVSLSVVCLSVYWLQPIIYILNCLSSAVSAMGHASLLRLILLSVMSVMSNYTALHVICPADFPIPPSWGTTLLFTFSSWPTGWSYVPGLVLYSQVSGKYSHGSSHFLDYFDHNSWAHLKELNFLFPMSQRFCKLVKKWLSYGQNSLKNVKKWVSIYPLFLSRLKLGWYLVPFFLLLIISTSCAEGSYLL